MIQLKINENNARDLVFDDIEGGRLSFHKIEGNRIAAEVSSNEFDQFLKTNNLISYHHELKKYEDGEVCGEFQGGSL